MAKAAILVIVFGVTLFALGMMPDVIATFIEELRNLRDNFSLTRGPIHGIQTDSAPVWLVVGGGVMMIVGLLVLVFKLKFALPYHFLRATVQHCNTHLSRCPSALATLAPLQSTLEV